MKNLLEKKLYPYVIKPGRYAGGEPGRIVKNHTNRVKYLHAFPDKYEIGQAYLGLQILYHIINKDDRFLCERVFAVDRDAEEKMRKEKIPLFSLESYCPANEFDAIGFTLTYELVYTNVLAMLDLAGIPLKACERTDNHPIIMAGGPAVYNPEPMSDFIDLFFIGDAEEGLPEILGILHNLQESSREEKLKEICHKVESVYIPAFYDSNKIPLFDFAPKTIKARVVKELKPEYYPLNPVNPLIDITHRHLSIEIMRGCPQGCRFCQAGPIYRPVRYRSQDDIINQVEKQIANTGQEEITLLSLSSSDYPDIENLAINLARHLEKQRVSISLPSLRPGTISPLLLDAVKKVRRGGLTISPEAGTERLRLFIRKHFDDNTIYDTARMAFDKGWTTIKLYFMIGLPSETEEDISGIVNIIKNIHEIGKKYPGRKTINVTLSPFVPKPHTPFQWDEIAPPNIILKKIKFIKNNLRINHVNLKYPLTESSLLQCLLGRSGREMSNVIASAYFKGCRFDGWNEDFKFDIWKDALIENEINIDEKLKSIPFDTPLPWSHIEKGVSSNHLIKERQRTSAQLNKYPSGSKGSVLSERDIIQNEYGRTKKKVISYQSIAPTKNRVRIRWGKSAHYRYMSHLDNLRLIERAIRHARIPVLYSQGFNPMMKLSFGPPLPLGFTSEAEFLDITLEANFMPYIVENIKKSLPEGLSVYDNKVVLTKNKSLSSLLNRVIYKVDTNLISKRVDLLSNIKMLLNSESLNIERTGKRETVAVEIRQAVYDLYIEDNFLNMILGMGDGGYARPSEVLTLLLGEEFDSYLLNSIHRYDMYRQNDKNEKISAMDL